MNKEKFEKLKDLEYRIDNLKMLRDYLMNYLSNYRFSLEIIINVLGENHGYKIPSADNSIKKSYKDDEDASWLIETIQKKINDLQKEFDNA